MESQLGKPPILPITAKLLQIVFPATTDKDGTTPYLPTTIGRRLRPPILSAATERIL